MVNKITEKFIEARKTKNVIMKSLYESIKTKIVVAEKSGQYALPLTDEIILSLIKKEIKERKETQLYYKPGDAQYDELVAQIKELQTYLPAELTEAEVIAIVKAVIVGMVESGSFNKGKAIGASVKEIGDRFEKSKIAAIVSKVAEELGL